jgi:hypothetical protein
MLMQQVGQLSKVHVLDALWIDAAITRHSSAIYAIIGNIGSVTKEGQSMRTLGKIVTTLSVVGSIAIGSAAPAAAWYGYHHPHHYGYYHHPYYHHHY